VSERRSYRIDEIVLEKTQQNYLQQLRDLEKSKPKEKADEILLENLARLEAEQTIGKDELVSSVIQ